MTDREKMVELKTPVEFVIDRLTIEESTALGREIMDRVVDCIRAELEACLDAAARAAEEGDKPCS